MSSAARPVVLNDARFILFDGILNNATPSRVLFYPDHQLMKLDVLVTALREAISSMSVNLVSSILLGGAALGYAVSTISYYRSAPGSRHRSLKSLRHFTPTEIIRSDGSTINILGRFAWQPDGEQSLLKVTSETLSAAQLESLWTSLALKLKSESGAEFAYYSGAVNKFSRLFGKDPPRTYSLEVISPATQKTVSRVRPSEQAMVTETSDVYAAVVGPYIAAQPEKALAWLKNVLSMEKEAERVLYNDPDPVHGFLLNIDTKWRKHPDPKTVARTEWYNHESTRDLYCLAICHAPGLATIRDLRGHHVQMLKAILSVGTSTIESVYGVRPEQLRVFLHYQPQFNHLHIHFNRLSNDFGCQVERAHLLTTVIENLQMDGDYYARSTLQYKLKIDDALYIQIKEYLDSRRS